MSRIATGWDLHRRFSHVSVIEQQGDGTFRTLRCCAEERHRGSRYSWRVGATLRIA